MSFFSRKPNPPVPALSPQAQQQLKHAASKPNPPQHAAQNWAVGVSPAAAAPKEQEQTPSNQRFRSFCERYIVERARDWKEEEVDARAWEAILQARSIYNKVREVGRTLTNDT